MKKSGTTEYEPFSSLIKRDEQAFFIPKYAREVFFGIAMRSKEASDGCYRTEKVIYITNKNEWYCEQSIKSYKITKV